MIEWIKKLKKAQENKKNSDTSSESSGSSREIMVSKDQISLQEQTVTTIENTNPSDSPAIEPCESAGALIEMSSLNPTCHEVLVQSYAKAKPAYDASFTQSESPANCMQPQLEFVARAINIGPEFVRMSSANTGLSEFFVRNTEFHEEPLLNCWYDVSGIIDLEWCMSGREPSEQMVLKTTRISYSSSQVITKKATNGNCTYHGLIISPVNANSYLAWIFEKRQEISITPPIGFSLYDWFIFYAVGEGFYKKMEQEQSIFPTDIKNDQLRIFVPAVSPSVLDESLLPPDTFDSDRCIWSPCLGSIIGTWPQCFSKNALVNVWVTRTTLGTGQWTFFAEGNELAQPSSTDSLSTIPGLSFIEGIVVKKIGHTTIILSEKGDFCFCSCDNHNVGDHVEFIIWPLECAETKFNIAVNCIIFCEQFLEFGHLENEFVIDLNIAEDDVNLRECCYPGIGIIEDNQSILSVDLIGKKKRAIITFQDLPDHISSFIQIPGTWVFKRILGDQSSSEQSYHSMEDLEAGSDNNKVNQVHLPTTPVSMCDHTISSDLTPNATGLTDKIPEKSHEVSVAEKETTMKENNSQDNTDNIGHSCAISDNKTELDKSASDFNTEACSSPTQSSLHSSFNDLNNAEYHTSSVIDTTSKSECGLTPSEHHESQTEESIHNDEDQAYSVKSVDETAEKSHEASDMEKGTTMSENSSQDNQSYAISDNEAESDKSASVFNSEACPSLHSSFNDLNNAEYHTSSVAETTSKSDCGLTPSEHHESQTAESIPYDEDQAYSVKSDSKDVTEEAESTCGSNENESQQNSFLDGQNSEIETSADNILNCSANTANSEINAKLFVPENGNNASTSDTELIDQANESEAEHNKSGGYSDNRNKNEATQMKETVASEDDHMDVLNVDYVALAEQVDHNSHCTNSDQETVIEVHNQELGTKVIDEMTQSTLSEILVKRINAIVMGFPNANYVCLFSPDMPLLKVLMKRASFPQSLAIGAWFTVTLQSDQKPIIVTTTGTAIIRSQDVENYSGNSLPLTAEVSSMGVEILDEICVGERSKNGFRYCTSRRFHVILDTSGLFSRYKKGTIINVWCTLRRISLHGSHWKIARTEMSSAIMNFVPSSKEQLKPIQQDKLVTPGK